MFGRKKKGIEAGPKIGNAQEDIIKKETAEDDLGEEEEIKIEKRGGPGFPRQEAMEEAEDKEIMDDLSKIYKEELGEESFGQYYQYQYEKYFSDVPEIPANRLEKIVNQFLKENMGKNLLNTRSGLLVSAAGNKSVEQYVKQEIEKGTKYEDIEPLTVNIKSEIPIDGIGFRNKGKMNWNIEGDVRKDIGTLMEDGEIRVKGNAGDYIGLKMKGGKITVEGDAGKGIGKDRTGGEIIVGGENINKESQERIRAQQAERIEKDNLARDRRRLEIERKRADYLKWQAENE